MTVDDRNDSRTSGDDLAPRWPARWKIGAVILSLSVLLGLMEAAQLYVGAALEGKPRAWGRAVMSVMPSWLIFAAEVPAILYLARRYPLDRGAWTSNAIVHVSGAIVFTLVHLGGTAIVYGLAMGDLAMASPVFSHFLSVYFVLDLITYGAFVGAYHAFRYYREFRARELAASQLQASLTTARLHALRAQLNPHFLFNTLNAVSVLATQGRQDEVVDVVGRLSDLLRRSLDESRSQEVTLAKELEFADAYLDIQRIRFGQRLTVLKRVAPDTLDTLVPSMILQPIIENAVIHGIAEAAGVSRIEISASRDDGIVRLQVRDTGPGNKPDGSIERPNGIGLSNTRARLEQLYGPDQRLELRHETDGGVSVTLWLPFRAQAASAEA
jgi:signal transduction histidine kinase